MKFNRMLLFVPAAILAVACGRDDSNKRVDDALNSDLSLAAQARPYTALDSISAAERAAQAQVINSLLNQALDLGNTRYQGQAIFGGQNGAINPFASVGGGYKPRQGQGCSHRWCRRCGPWRRDRKQRRQVEAVSSSVRQAP